MKYLFILFLLSKSNIAHSQFENITTDSLKKYSYLIYGNKKLKIQNGTGFFIRYKGTLYFVTARHVITGCREEGEKIKYQPDTMNLLNKHKLSSYPIYVKEIYEKSVCYPQYVELDIEAFKIDSRWDLGINTVDSFFGNSLFEYNQFATWGFPFYNMVEGNQYDIMKEPILITGEVPDFWMTRPYADTSNTKEDTLNYLLHCKSIVINKNLGGASGSPVFLRNTTTNRWQIVGALIGAPNELAIKKQFTIARIEAILKKIEKIHQSESSKE